MIGRPCADRSRVQPAGADRLYRVCARVAGRPDYIVEVRAPRAGLAITRAMLAYPSPLRGARVDYDVSEVVR